MSCETSLGCNEYYIAETSYPLRASVRVQQQHINTAEYRQIPFSEHLERCGNKQFYVFLFYNLLSDSEV